MNFLPKEIEDTIIDYKEQIEKEEHKKRFNKTLKKIKKDVEVLYSYAEDEEGDESDIIIESSLYFDFRIQYFICYDYHMDTGELRDIKGNKLEYNKDVLNKLIIYDTENYCSIVLD